MKIQTLLLSALTFFALTSCENESGDTISPSSVNQIAEVKIIDGRMVFPNREALISTTNKIAVLNTDQYNQWVQTLDSNQPFKGYVIVDSVDSLPLVYSRILNQSGAFQVGDQVAVYKNGKEYEVSATNYAKITQAGTSIQNQPNVLVHEARKVLLVGGDNDTKSGSSALRSFYDDQRQFYYGGQERKITHQVSSFANINFMVVEVTNKLERYVVRSWIRRNSWEIDGYNCHKTMGPLTLSWTGMTTPLGDPGAGSILIGIPQETWGNNSLVSSYSFAADAMQGATLTGSIFTEFWGNDLDNRNLNWYLGVLSK